MLQKHMIERSLASPLRVEVHSELSSTNTAARALAESGFGDDALIVARSQSGGRGRLGRSFFSPDGGLYMSLLINRSMNADAALHITTAAATAVARAIDRTADVHSEIKWVNDVYLHGRKVCGILTEAKAAQDGRIAYTVLGIGVNLIPPSGGFPADIADRAGAVFQRIEDDCDNRLAAQIVNEFTTMLDHGLDRSLYLDEYRSRSCVIGREVSVMHIHDGEAIHATAVAIDDDCRLVVRYADGTAEALGSGEVSIRM